MMTLNEIAGEYAAIEALLWETGELGEVAEEALDEYLNRLDAERDRKIEAYCHRLRTIEATAKIRREEAKRLAELAETDQRNAERMKARLLAFFEAQGIERLDLDRFRIWTQSNGGKAPLAIDEWAEANAFELEPRFQVRTVRVAADAVREALEAGEKLNFARLLPRGRHIRIK